jgi:hypothetical protein
LRTQVRQRGAGELHRRDEVQRDLLGDVLVADLLGGTEQSATGVGDDHVDAS